MVQVIKGRDASGWRGLLLIAAMVAVLYLLSLLLGLIKPLIGYTAASLTLWLLGACEALWVMREFVLGYRYELDGLDLRLGRVYGERVRFMDQALLRDVVAWGDEADMKARFPEAKVSRAVKKSCPLPHLALAIRGSAPRILVIQPDEKMRGALEKALKARE